MAVAVEQENKAKIEEMKAKVVESESKIPLAIAKAFEDGNISVFEYEKLKNLKSDTKMRESLSE